MVTVQDTIELPDLLKVINDYELDEDYSKVMDIIYDFREGAIDISPDGMIKLVEYLKVKKQQTFRTAWSPLPRLLLTRSLACS